MWQNSDCDRSDSSDSSDNSDNNDKNKLFSRPNIKKLKTENYVFCNKKISQKIQTQIAMKLKNLNCDKTQKLKLYCREILKLVDKWSNTSC